MKKQTLKLTAVAAALTTAFAPAFADDAEMKELIKPDSSVSVGVGGWSNNRPQQGVFDAMKKDGAYALIDADVQRRDDATGTWLTFGTRNLGLENRELRAEWLRQGVMGFSFEYNRITRDNPYTFNTGLRGIGSAAMTVSGAGANALPFSQVELGTHRDLIGLGFYRNIMPGLDLTVTFKNEEKNGTRQWGRGGQPEFLVEPIDATTRQLEAILSYAGERFQISGGYYGSWYDNAYGYIDSIRNGDNAALTASHIYLSQPLDNQAHQLFVNAGYAFTPTTRGTLKMSYTRATQNEQMPTRSIVANPANPPFNFAGAPTNLQGEINTSQLQLGLTSRPLPKLSIAANLNYHNAKDKTPIFRVIQNDGNDAGNAVCDSAGECVDNTPFSFKTITGKLEATYRLPYDFSVIGGLEERRQDRTLPVGSISTGPNNIGVDTQRYVPFRAELDETTYRLQLRRSLSDTVNGSLAYLHSKRKGSQYSLTEEVESDQITPLHIADRKRDKWRMMIDWAPNDMFGLQFNVEEAHDKYPTDGARPYGLRDGKARLYSLDASVNVSDNLQLTAWYSHDDTRATQTGQRATNSNAGRAEKNDQLRDTGDSIGFGVRAKPSGKIRLGADFQHTRNVSKYGESLTLTAAGNLFPNSGAINAVGPLPDVQNKITRLSVFMEYALQKNSDLRFDFIHERWTTNDWSWLFSDGTAFVYGANTDGTTVTFNPKQTTNFLGVRYIYKFQ